jgi:hypothetical protein
MNRLQFTSISFSIACLSLVSCGPQSQTTSDGTQVTPNPTPMVTINTGSTTNTVEPPPAPMGTAPVVVPPILSPITQANLDRVTKDMSPSEVTSILGQPTSSDSSPIPIVGGTQTTYHYDNGASSVTIVFKNNEMKSN